MLKKGKMTMPLTIKQLLDEFPCRLLCGEDLDNRSVTGGYACDMLSWVISRAKGHAVWFTVLNSINVLAVATLSECACVMLTESVDMEEIILARAREKSLVVLATALPTYEAAVALDRILRKHQP